MLPLGLSLNPDRERSQIPFLTCSFLYKNTLRSRPLAAAHAVTFSAVPRRLWAGLPASASSAVLRSVARSELVPPPEPTSYTNAAADLLKLSDVG